jgi:hypothetical protein
MIDRIYIEKLIENYSLNFNQETLQRLADDVIRDSIPLIYAMIRDVVAEERKKQFVIKNVKEKNSLY